MCIKQPGPVQGGWGIARPTAPLAEQGRAVCLARQADLGQPGGDPLWRVSSRRQHNPLFALMSPD